MSGRGRLARLAGAIPDYLFIAWWGLVRPRIEREPLVVAQGVVLSGSDVLLTFRRGLRGWELPGGNLDPGESSEAALEREVREETGLVVEIERHVGDYVRTGFRPHTARVYRCRAREGALRPSLETPQVRWFPAQNPSDMLFPWYRRPLADALPERGEPVVVRERWGLRDILAGMAIDLRMRWRG